MKIMRSTRLNSNSGRGSDNGENRGHEEETARVTHTITKEGKLVVVNRRVDSPPPVVRETRTTLPDGRHCLVRETADAPQGEAPTRYGSGGAAAATARPMAMQSTPNKVDLNFVTMSLASISVSVSECATAFNKLAENVKETGRHLRAVHDKTALLKEVVGYHPPGSSAPLTNDGLAPEAAVELDELRKKLSEMTAKAGIYRRETNQKDDSLAALRKSYAEWKVFTDRQVAKIERELEARRAAEGLSETVTDALDGVEQSILRLRIAVAGGTHARDLEDAAPATWYELPTGADHPVDVLEEVEEKVDVESVDAEVGAEVGGGEPPKKKRSPRGPEKKGPRGPDATCC